VTRDRIRPRKHSPGAFLEQHSRGVKGGGKLANVLIIGVWTALCPNYKMWVDRTKCMLS